ncbi:rhomboid family intramembrane serine protease [bacterium]|nr:rhomboid family intramembrane serine protease [bacterium]
MIPLRDTVPSSTFPVVTVALIVINGAIFIFEWFLGSDISVLFSVLGIIPAKYFWMAQHQPADYLGRFGPLVSSMFLHGGWMHVISNMWYLWIFGDNVEDRMGHKKFLLFYVLCGLGAGLTHIYLNSDSPIPTVGASGAIAGVMGAYIVLYPKARVMTLLPIFIFIQIIEIPAYFFLGFWILLQFFQGTMALGAEAHTGGVAWWAHLGGFVFGALLVFLFRKPEGRYVVVEEDR